MPEGALEQMASAKALLLGAVGDPAVPPGPLEQELLLAMRFHYDQYVNLRPCRSWPNARNPVSLGSGRLSVVVVRENTEDFYIGMGGRFEGGCDGAPGLDRGLYQLRTRVHVEAAPRGAAPARIEGAYALGILTAPAVERIARRAFRIALERGEDRIHLATKSNALPQFYGFWDERVERLGAAEFPSVKIIRINVDNLCYQLVRAPLSFGVVLCPNLFGDIVSDLVSALAGGLGMSPSGNLGDGLCMFEPIHGSAPKLMGTGRANPLAAILSAAMMLSHLGEAAAAAAVERAVEDYLAAGEELPVELGGPSPCVRVGALVKSRVLASRA
jgi:3-isopropylmalate dehydrogenase